MTTTHSAPTTVRFVALREQYEQLKPRIDAAIASVIGRSAFIAGPEVEEFERWFAAYCGVGHALGVASGTTAIELVLRALDVGPESEVILPANTFIGSAAAVVATGARPVFVDVDERTCNVDPRAVAAVISPRTKAILPVHLYGRPAAVGEIIRLARSVPVVEDAAQAHGARSTGASVGSLGVAGCFSFYPTKNLGAFGDAGLITTNNDGLARRVRLLRDHGRVSQYEHAIVGQTARLDNLQAAVLRVQADCLEEWNARRRQVADWYRDVLPPGIVCPDADDRGDLSVYHVFVVRVAERDAFRTYLAEHGISTAVHYPVPLHLQTALQHLGYGPGDFPVTERLSREVVSLPMHPFVERSQVQYIADVAAGFLRQ